MPDAKTGTKKTTRTKAAVKAETAEEVTVKEPVKKAPKREFDLHEYIPVRNGFQGKLVYRSKKTGELFVWEEFGDTLDMELLELRDAKVTNKKLFLNNYFIIEDEEVLSYLGVKMFYNNVLPVDDFDEIFTLPKEELRKVIEDLPEGQKASVAYRARKLIDAKAIDSISLIETLEEALKTQLLDRD